MMPQVPELNRAAINLTPYQGLKPKIEKIGLILPDLAGINLKSLSGIET